MKILSLRQFRERAAEVHEPVQIAVRDKTGNLQILGYYTPYMQDVPGSEELAAPMTLDLGEVAPEAVEEVVSGLASGVIKTPEEARAVAATVSPVRAFPKSAQTGRKKR